MPVGSVESLGPSITYFVSCKGAIQGGIGALVAVVFAHGAASVGNRFLEKFLQTRFRISLEGEMFQFSLAAVSSSSGPGVRKGLRNRRLNALVVAKLLLVLPTKDNGTASQLFQGVW